MAFADARQEYYTIGIGTQQQATRLADKYSTWSATSAVQYLSQHTEDAKELKSYLSIGQQGRFYYRPRRPKAREDIYTDNVLGIAVELKKNMTAIIRLHKIRASKDAHPDRDKHYEDITKEILRLSKILPEPKVFGLTESEQNRLQTAFTKVGTFQLAQLANLDKIVDRALAHTVNEIRKAENHGIDTWIQEILDPQKGYSKAHSWTRGAPKAPPLPTEMWRNGQQIGHPHYIAQALLQD